MPPIGKKLRMVLVVLAALASSLGGCGGGDDTPVAAKSEKKKKPKPKPKPSAATAKPAEKPRPERTDDDSANKRPVKTLKGLIDEADAPDIRPEAVDDATLASSGIRKLTSEHLTLYTDLPASPAVDELPRVFDLAVPQWCQYLGIAPAQAAGWKVRGAIMKDKSKFAGTPLLPGNLPPFEHGYARPNEIWLYDKPSDYYRRHLVLHEGTHAIMHALLGGAGPPWYMEGVAELLGTHRWDGKQLELGYFPKSREEAPHWGRVKLVRDAIAKSRGLTLADVLRLDYQAHQRTESYAWSWAAASFLHGHPRYQARFDSLVKEVARDPADFNIHWRQIYEPDLEELAEEWQAFVASLEYGHDLKRTAIEFKAGQPLPENGAKVSVSADRGWQSSQWQVEDGQKYVLRASGRYQVADRPKIWWCEPNGVSFRYYHGQPLGMLFAAVRPERVDAGQVSPFLRPLAVGLGGEIKPPHSGTLYFRINDSPAELADNKGILTVEITSAEDGK
jgi:hypothetical protein